MGWMRINSACCRRNSDGAIYKNPNLSVQIVGEAARPSVGGMQVTGVTQHHVSHSLDASFEPTWIPGYAQHSHRAEVFEVGTDAGSTGVTAYPSFAGGLEYETPLSHFLQGEDPHDIESIMGKLASIDLLNPAPHAGFKESGMGRELAEEALDDYSEIKTVKMNFGGVPKF